MWPKSENRVLAAMPLGFRDEMRKATAAERSDFVNLPDEQDRQGLLLRQTRKFATRVTGEAGTKAIWTNLEVG
jgi:hypothetical protein